jgi:hypothetical protein
MGTHHKIKPARVLDYNKNKTGVERSDQILSHYSFARKTIKWWMQLFFHIFDLAVVNAHTLHTKTSKKKISLELFSDKLPKDCLLVLVQSFKYTARLAVQLADSQEKSLFI